MHALLNVLFFAQIIFTLGMQPKHAKVIRDLAKKQNLPDFVTVQDSIQRGQLAFTSADLKHIYLDLNAFENAPNTLQNVLKHEIGHANGHVHNDQSPYMQYGVRLDINNNVINDDWVLLP